MMTDAWAVVAAALGSSTLTIVATFGLELWRERRARKKADADRLRNSCVQLASHAISFALRAQALYATGISRSGIKEGLDVALYYRKPLDPRDPIEWLLIDMGPMLEAQSLIEVSADEELIRTAGDLIQAANVVLEKTTDGLKKSLSEVRQPHDATPSRQVASYFRALIPLKRDPEVEDAINSAVKGVVLRLRQFGRVTRERLGVNDPDAVIRAFPELFGDHDQAEGK